MKAPHAHLRSAAFALLAVVTSAQTLTSVSVYRSAENVQTDATTVAINPAPVSATYGGPFGWGISVEGTGLSAPRVSAMPGATNNSTLNPTQHNNGTLGYSDGAWQYGSPNFNNIGFPGTGAGALDRNARFPTGVYTIEIPGFSDVSLNYQHSSVDLNSPTFTLSGGLWSGGVYLIDPTQTLTITSSSHNAFLSGNVNGGIGFAVVDSGDNAIAGGSMRYRSDASPGADSISYTINPHTLTAGSDYTLIGLFRYITDQNSTNGSFNTAHFDAVTSLTISAVSAIPEPSTYAALAGLGALGLALWRRRRQAQTRS